ncbi:YfiR family protein [Paraglaciecola aestuariivivens]
MSDQKAQLTAAFIYRITKFTTWPTSVFSAEMPSFNICVIASPEDSVTRFIADLDNKTTQGYQINVVQLLNKQQLFAQYPERCQVIYALEANWLTFTQQEMSELAKTALMIGTSKRFLREGGMLALIVVSNKMKIYINLENFEDTSIKLETRLKALAKTL